MELVILFLVYGGGVAAAFALMVIASRSETRFSTLGLGILALLCLFVQGGCWRAASDFGRATGGGGGSAWLGIIVICIIGCLIWLFLLVSSRHQ